MKRTVWIQLLYVCSVLLLFGFLLRAAAGVLFYDPAETSAPLALVLLGYALEYLLPGGIALAAAVLLQKKNRNS